MIEAWFTRNALWCKFTNQGENRCTQLFHRDFFENSRALYFGIEDWDSTMTNAVCKAPDCDVLISQNPQSTNKNVTFCTCTAHITEEHKGDQNQKITGNANNN